MTRKPYLCLFLTLFLILPCWADIESGLIGHWPMEGNGNDIVQGLEPRVVGDPHYTAGIEGLGATIDLDGDDCLIVGEVGITGGVPRSLAGWVQATSQTQRVWSSGFGFTSSAENASSGAFFDLELSAGGNTYALHTYGGRYDIIPVDLEWHHFAFVYEAGTSVVYADGLRHGELSRDLNTFDSFVIGWRETRNAYFVGRIDDVRLYDRVLTADDVDELYWYVIEITKAWLPTPTINEVLETQNTTLRWYEGDDAKSHTVYFSESMEDVQNGVASALLGSFDVNEIASPTLEWGKTYYWRVDEVGESQTYQGDLWSFSVAPRNAYDPVPIDQAQFRHLDTDLSWTSAPNTGAETIFFGTSFDDVNSAIAGTSVTGSSYDPGPLAHDMTYYWRVDSTINGTTYKGPVWSYQTTPANGGILSEYFNNTELSGAPVATLVESSSGDAVIDYNWADVNEPAPGVAESSFSIRWSGELTVPVTGTWSFIVRLTDGLRITIDGQLIVEDWRGHVALEKVGFIDLEAGRPYSFVMETYQNGGNGVCQLFWQGPGYARELVPTGPIMPRYSASAVRPPDGEVNINQATPLSWSAGLLAAEHDVYFSTDADAVAAATPETEGVYRGRFALADTVYTLPESPLADGTTYYWRVDEVNDLHPDKIWPGQVWSFTTADLLVIEDFEDCNDIEGFEVFVTWMDGYLDAPAGNGTGAQVGHDQAPWAEQSNKNGGAQSMPLYYSNIGMGGENFGPRALYAEADRVWDEPQDWQADGAAMLTLHVRGVEENFLQPLYLGLQSTGSDLVYITHEDPNAVRNEDWTAWDIPFADVTGVDFSAVTRLTIGIGDRDATDPNELNTGVIYVDDIWAR